jgi:F0F1-type ATP synthase beta subunit
VVDEQQGPTTKREYDIAVVPVGEALLGKVVDFLGRPPGAALQLGTSAFAPLFAEQPGMEAREQIAQALVTGVKVGVLLGSLCLPFLGRSHACPPDFSGAGADLLLSLTFTRCQCGM